MFYPITSKTACTAYWGSEAQYAEMLTRARFPIFPARKEPSEPTKAWTAHQPLRYIDNDAMMAGALVIRAGATGRVVQQNQRIDQLSTDVWIVPQEYARYMSQHQVRFIIEYRDHADFKAGFPVFAPWLSGVTQDVAWLSTPNFYEAPGHDVAPVPIALPLNWMMRWKPGTGHTAESRVLANVECFELDEYTSKFKAPAPQPVVKGEYLYSPADLAQQSMMALMTSGPTAAAGDSIRKMAEARK